MRKLFLFLAAMTVAISVNAASARTIYLKPGIWDKDGARFAICILSNPQTWVDMTAVVGEEGIYSADVPTDKQVIFCRMNGATSENNWDNKWNQTQDMTLDAEKDMCVITGWDTGEWSKYEPAPEPVGCDWENINWVGSALTPKYVEQFKVCVGENAPNVDVFQHPNWGTADGLYMTFPSAVWDKSKFSIPESQYDLQGAGMLIHVSAFDLEYNEITINCDNKDFVFTVYNADGAEEVYNIAGSSATAFGTTWDTYANGMTLNEGLYKWEKEELLLAEGEIAFKVVKDHDWDQAWPAQDYKLNIPEEGIYTITITFNADSKVIEAVATKTGEAVVVPKIKLHGNFSGSWADSEVFVEALDKKSASLTVEIAKGNYEFGIHKDGTWTANGVAFTRANSSAVVESGSGNLTLAADVAGEYVFTWTFETNTLSITYPVKYYEYATGHEKKADFGDPSGRILLTLSKSGNDIVVTIKNNNAAGNPQTGLNFLWVNATGATNNNATYGSHDTENTETVSVTVKFNAAQESYNFVNIHWSYAGWGGEWALDGLTVKASELCELVDGYYLVGTFNGAEEWSVEDLTPDKRFAANTESAGEYFVVADLEENDALKVASVKNDAIVKWYPEEGGNYVVGAAYAAEGKTIYFRPDYEGGEGWHYGCIFIPANDPTAIDNTVVEGKAVKMIKNGMLLIERDGKTYNVLGAEVK